jgi:hypothetical protein
MREGKVIRTVFLLLLLLTIVTGCRKTGDNIVDSDIIDSDIGDSEEAESVSLYDIYSEGLEAGWKQGIETETDGNKRTINIDADIDIPDAESMAVAFVEEQDFNEAWKEEIVAALYGNARTELRPIGDEWYGMLGTYSETDCTYAGDINGISYVLLFQEGNLGRLTREKKISFKAADFMDVSPALPDGASSVLVYPVEEAGADNACSLTEEEAETTARQFAERLGFSDLEPAEVMPLGWTVNTGDGFGEKTDVIEGYAITLRHCIYGVFYDDTEENYEEYYNTLTTTSDRYCITSEMTIYVNSCGVIYMSYVNPLKVNSVTENVPLLSLDNIKDIMAETLKEQSKTEFNEMKLMYFRLCDDKSDGSLYSYVPAWRLAYRVTSGNPVKYCVVVNAIDGSVIDVEKEVYGIPEDD